MSAAALSRKNAHVVTHWIIGDIHGCARELELLLQRLRLAPADRLISVGDLFHRGPDPVGVMDILAAHGASFVLGNHEHAVLAHCGLAPRRSDGRDRPRFCASFPELDEEDLAGDGGLACAVAAERRADVVRYLQTHAGYAIESSGLDGAPTTVDGREWLVVHAGVAADKVADNSIRTLTSLRRIEAPGRPWWYESYRGPRLVVFGHTPSRLPRMWRIAEHLVALGLDTGCVYGGSLTAYAPELDEFASIPASKAYARTS